MFLSLLIIKLPKQVYILKFELLKLFIQLTDFLFLILQCHLIVKCHCLCITCLIRLLFAWTEFLRKSVYLSFQVIFLRTLLLNLSFVFVALFKHCLVLLLVYPNFVKQASNLTLSSSVVWNWVELEGAGFGFDIVFGTAPWVLGVAHFLGHDGEVGHFSAFENLLTG